MGRERLIALLNFEDTMALGKKIAVELAPNAIIALSGDLGAGKTTFVQGLALGLGILEPILSPTFVTLNLYEGSLPLYHFDLYRLKGSAEFFQQGFEEYFQMGGICAIEWPERIASFLPSTALSIALSYSSSGRIAHISSWRSR